jgi:rhamnogalacturonyl hydrolase YesR
MSKGSEREYAAAERKKIIEWLSPLNPFQRHADVVNKHQEGTGLWFLNDVHFVSWKESCGTTLWCYGIRM